MPQRGNANVRLPNKGLVTCDVESCWGLSAEWVLRGRQVTCGSAVKAVGYDWHISTLLLLEGGVQSDYAKRHLPR